MSKALRQLKLIMEYLWLVVATISLGFGIYETFTKSFQKSWPFFAFVMVALFFYTTRRNQRINKNN